MFNPFSPLVYYVKIQTNEMVVKNISTCETIKKKSPKPFSSKRLILADFEPASELLKSIIAELRPSFFYPIYYNIAIHVMGPIEGGLSEIEKRALRDLAEYAGAKNVLISEYKYSLKDQQITEGFKSRNWKFGYN